MSGKIFEIKNYINEQGMRISSLIETGFDQNKKIVHTGFVAVPIANNQQLPIEFQFPEGLDLDQCFEQFEEVAKKEVKEQIEEMKRQQRANNIIPATAMPPVEDPKAKGWSLV